MTNSFYASRFAGTGSAEPSATRDPRADERDGIHQEPGASSASLYEIMISSRIYRCFYQIF